MWCLLLLLLVIVVSIGLLNLSGGRHELNTRHERQLVGQVLDVRGRVGRELECKASVDVRHAQVARCARELIERGEATLTVAAGEQRLQPAKRQIGEVARLVLLGSTLDTRLTISIISFVFAFFHVRTKYKVYTYYSSLWRLFTFLVCCSFETPLESFSYFNSIYIYNYTLILNMKFKMGVRTHRIKQRLLSYLVSPSSSTYCRQI